MLNAQSDTSKGISFEKDLTWVQVQAKAQSENKGIFVDFYGTWCGPCKAMDSVVYSLASVGYFTNAHFISVKVQIDSTAGDDVRIRSWYSVAREMRGEYQIEVLPTFLFFTAYGKLVHRFSGFIKPLDFILVAKDATDTGKQCYALLDKFKNGILSDSLMPKLARTFESLGDKETAKQIAHRYIDGYLWNLSDHEILTKEHLEFAGDYIQSSDDKGFHWFYHHSRKIDKIVRKGYAETIIDRVINREEVSPFLITYKGKDHIIDREPDWMTLRHKIHQKYSEKCADRIIINTKIYWYSRAKKWQELIDAYIKRVDRYGLDTAGRLGFFLINNMVYDVIFKYSNSKRDIKKAIKWMKIIVFRNHNISPIELDTYANLLYKLGRREEAIYWESRAVSIDPKVREIRENFQKMKAGKPTWL